MPVAFNPYDPLQQNFLSALSLGEVGSGGSSWFEGVGSTSSNPIDLSGTSTDQYGFPQWSGTGNSHAAGAFQFEPSTWDSIAQQYGLNFQNPQDQLAGAWYLAQQKDPNLESDLSSGNFSTIQNLLKNVWPSVTGNAAAPMGLAQDLSSGTGNNVLSSIVGTISNLVGGGVAGAAGAAGASAGISAGTGAAGQAQNLFLRGALIVVGALVVVVALWALLASTGAVPGPIETGKIVGKAALA